MFHVPADDAVLPPVSSHNVLVALGAGSAGGYSDTEKQVVRTAAGTVYVAGTNCDTYPCTSSTQTVRVWKANNTTIPTAFTRKDSGNEPANTGGIAMAIDSSDTIHLVWLERATPYKLRYATFSTTTDTWGTKEDIDSNLGAVPDAGQGDEFISLALDSNGKPHVAYGYLNSIRRLAYRNRVSGAWSSMTTGIDDNTYVSNRKMWNPTLAFDSSGRRVFLWHVGAFNTDTDGQMCLRVMDTDDTLGTRADIGASTAKVGIDQGDSLLVSGGQLHVTWILGGALGSEFVRYSYATEAKSPTFTANNPTNADTHDPCLAPGSTGTIRIYGHGSMTGGDNANLYYWQSTGGAGTWSARISYQVGSPNSYDSSVSARWSQYTYTNTRYLDVVYWDDTYPNTMYYGVDRY